LPEKVPVEFWEIVLKAVRLQGIGGAQQFENNLKNSVSPPAFGVFLPKGLFE